MLAATLIERSPFARKIELLERVAKFKGKVFETRVNRLTAVIKPLRKRRNLFIHGCWYLSPKLLAQGEVAVTDSLVYYDESERRGVRMEAWRTGIAHVLRTTS